MIDMQTGRSYGAHACPRENGERGKEPTPNPSQEGNCGVSSQACPRFQSGGE